MSYTKENRKKATLYWGGGSLTGQAAVDGSPQFPPNKSQADWDDSFTGAFNPNWRLQVRNGQNATTPAGGYRRQFRGAYGTYGHVFGYINGIKVPANARRVWTAIPSGLPSPVVPSVGPNDSATQNSARMKFAKSVERVSSLFSGGVFLAELRETLNTIKNPAKSLRKHVGDYLSRLNKRQGRMRRLPPKTRLGVLQDSWLEASFGWMPTLNDLNDARSYLQARQDALYQELVPVKGHAEMLWLMDDVAEQTTVGVLQVSHRKRTRRYAGVFLSGAVSSKAAGQQLINASAMGLAPRSFVPTLWEVIPWSFLFDYFTNIGDVITAWSNQTVALAWGRETSVRETWVDLYDIKADVTASFKPTFLVETCSVTPGGYDARIRTFSRSPITTAPIPSFQFEIPGMGTKWLNMAALLQFKKGIMLH